MLKTIEEDLVKYYEAGAEENERIWAYLEKHEGYEPEMLHLTDNIPKAEFLSFARAIAQTLYIRDAMRGTSTCKAGVDSDAAALLEKERYGGSLFITLDDLCLRCYGSKGGRERARMSAFVNKLHGTFVAGKVSGIGARKKCGIESEHSLCANMMQETREDGAVLYEFIVNPLSIMLSCLTDSLWQETDGNTPTGWRDKYIKQTEL